MILSTTSALRIAMAAPAMVSLLFVSGCMSSPTYGTDKTANEQLLNDVTSITALQPKQQARIAYQPRPDLVKPASTKDLTLPAPQESVADASSADWPESPEARRARIRGEVDEKSDQGAFRGGKGPIASEELAGEIATASIDEPKLGQSMRHRPGTDTVGQEARRAEFKRRMAENNQGSPTSRKYLSEPPLDYRQPAASAATDDLGEDEWKKERRLKAEARKKSGGKSWRDYIPGF